ncbi:MAG TPA: hypothetical protein VHL11_13775 [Phototrophicaceae bacterium]|jgi:hypothetical protein|nr:hypothetical protein [Phototrophicaceae bacterium]
MTKFKRNMLKSVLIIGLLTFTVIAFLGETVTSGAGKLLPSEPTFLPATLESYWNNPLPTPRGITHVEKETKNGWSFCPFLINEWAIRLFGDKEEDVSRSIKNSLSFNIDGSYHRLTTEGSLEGVNDADGSWIFFSLCLPIENLSIGLHSAKIEFTDTQGKIYSYTWAFKVIPPE